MMLDIKLQIWETQRTPSRINASKPTPRHIIFKFQKIRDKEKNLQISQSGGGKKHLYGGTEIRITCTFSETNQAGGE